MIMIGFTCIWEGENSRTAKAVLARWNSIPCPQNLVKLQPVKQGGKRVLQVFVANELIDWQTLRAKGNYQFRKKD